MNEGINDDVYSKLLDATYTVELEREGKSLILTCRELPFTTLMAVIGAVATSAQDELVRARRQLAQDISLTGVEGIKQEMVTQTMMPVLQAAILEIPAVTHRFLCDVVVGMTADRVQLFTVDDVAAVLNAVLARVDAEKIAKKMTAVFSQATRISDAVGKTQEKKINKQIDREKKKGKTLKSSSQKESPA